MIATTFGGIEILTNDVQLLKVSALIIINEVGIFKDLREEQFSKQPSPSFSIVIGSDTFTSDSQELKALSSITLTDEGMMISFNDKQELKVLLSINVTEDGIVICDSLLQPIKHFGGMMLSGWDNKRLIIS